jgi:prepilin-type N-terminal cleavage/methylation domain-containing protein
MKKHQSGFTAVELLITLFVGAAFIATGYQLYSAIIQNSGEARFRSKASNIAYDYLRRYASQATNPCSTVTPSPTPTLPTDSGLSRATLTVAITCPWGTSAATSKIQVTITYGSPQEEVAHALYVTK